MSHRSLMAKDQLEQIISAGTLIKHDYTYVEGNCTSLLKQHLLAAFICRPGTDAGLISIHAIYPKQLHEIALEMTW